MFERQNRVWSRIGTKLLSILNCSLSSYYTPTCVSACVTPLPSAPRENALDCVLRTGQVERLSYSQGDWCAVTQLSLSPWNTLIGFISSEFNTIPGRMDVYWLNDWINHFELFILKSGMWLIIFHIRKWILKGLTDWLMESGYVGKLGQITHYGLFLFL